MDVAGVESLKISLLHLVYPVVCRIINLCSREV